MLLRLGETRSVGHLRNSSLKRYQDTWKFQIIPWLGTEEHRIRRQKRETLLLDTPLARVTGLGPAVGRSQRIQRISPYALTVHTVQGNPLRTDPGGQKVQLPATSG